MRIILQRHATAEAAQHYGLPPAVINAYFDKEAAAFISAVVEISAVLNLAILN